MIFDYDKCFVIQILLFKLNAYNVVSLDSSIQFHRPNEEGTKEMFYLMTHSTHFIYDYMVSVD